MKYNEDDRILPKQTTEQRNIILRELKKQGCRITNQRKIIIDAILENECSSCKEIHAEVIGKDPRIGIATVYRMINALEAVGAINRKNLYRLSECDARCCESACTVVLKNKDAITLTGDEFANIIKAGMHMVYGCKERDIESIMMGN